MAERQDWRLVGAIFDYRNARTAIDMLNGGDKGYEQLAKQPHLQQLLLELVRAQGDTLAEFEDVVNVIRAGQEDEETE